MLKFFSRVQIFANTISIKISRVSNFAKFTKIRENGENQYPQKLVPLRYVFQSKQKALKFSCEVGKFFNNTFLYRTSLMNASLLQEAKTGVPNAARKKFELFFYVLGGLRFCLVLRQETIYTELILEIFRLEIILDFRNYLSQEFLNDKPFVFTFIVLQF